MFKSCTGITFQADLPMHHHIYINFFFLFFLSFYPVGEGIFVVRERIREIRDCKRQSCVINVSQTNHKPHEHKGAFRN